MTDDRDKRRARLFEGLIGLREYTGQHGFIVDLRAELEASERDREALAELMAYVDEAITAAQAGGRITGEPLADYIKRIIEETKEGT